MKKNLDHLTEEQIESLIERYYNNEKVSVLLKEYEIDTNPSTLYKLFPEQTLQSLCPYCSIALIQKYASKGYQKRMADARCPQCEHKESQYCNCKSCRERERRNKERQQAQLKIQEMEKKEYLVSYLTSIYETSETVNLESISFQNQIYLGALLREGISEDFNYIRPVETFINPLAPTPAYQREIINGLYRSGVIAIHPDSDYSAFVDVDINANHFKFNTFKVRWLLNVHHDDLNKVPLINSIINPTTIPDSQEAYLLWREIARNESIEYLIYSAKNVMGVDYAIGDKTISVMEDLLNDFSVSQIYNLIYKATNGALRFQSEKGVAKSHAVNSIVGSAQRYAERAKVEGWDIQKYGRQKECPESALSKFFFERVLKIGYNGFNQTPHILP